MKKIGVNWLNGENITREKQAEEMLKIGFSSIFYGSDKPDIEEVALACKVTGLKIETLHAPFAKDEHGVSINSLWSPKGSEDGDIMEARFMDAVEKCGRFEVPYVILHASSAVVMPPQINPDGLERFHRVIDRARALGVTPCIENQRVIANVAALLDEFPDAKFCWDTGHEIVFGNSKLFMPMFGERLGALHLQDNIGIPGADVHRIPGDGTLDWDLVAKFIAAARFRGTMMMELKKSADGPYAALDIIEFYKKAFVGGKMVSDLVEKYEKVLATKGAITHTFEIKY